MNEIKLHDTVALTENMKITQFMTDREVILPRGQVGTVVEIYDQGKAFEVEFANKNGQTYALISIELEKLMLLYTDCSNLIQR
ncbi:MAG: DUF4926 domain-containing protein [Okeania sp. SIO3I5]|uniref:DUF4926 domain-containing protein n=1 Tax=Okeania sp. SIO3I5 TaxID=2607805 RepID=UPI0013B6154F|nr:DUF4926 domain-containing protein [Okeania sp. SIO3I5]NEQ35737.1 DUF4926 domain-containing protein [Okeania sp. SIO3I5]